MILVKIQSCGNRRDHRFFTLMALSRDQRAKPTVSPTLSLSLLHTPLVFLNFPVVNVLSFLKAIHMVILLDFEFHRCISFFFFSVFFWGRGANQRHLEVPRLGGDLELQLPAYTTATATQDPSCVCDLHHSHSHVGSEPCL